MLFVLVCPAPKLSPAARGMCSRVVTDICSRDRAVDDPEVVHSGVSEWVEGPFPYSRDLCV